MISLLHTAKGKTKERAARLAELFAGRKSTEGMKDALFEEVHYLIWELELIDECMNVCSIRRRKPERRWRRGEVSSPTFTA